MVTICSNCEYYSYPDKYLKYGLEFYCQAPDAPVANFVTGQKQECAHLNYDGNCLYYKEKVVENNATDTNFPKLSWRERIWNFLTKGSNESGPM